MPQYFLAKTDPDTYSIDDFKEEKTTLWDGVHNYAAINCIKTWEIGDIIYIYHSQGENRIVGLAKVTHEPFENLIDPRFSFAAKLQFVTEYTESEKATLSLKNIKSTGLFPDFSLVRNSRLSTMSCPAEFVAWVKSQVLG